jgi:hypothetical protein
MECFEVDAIIRKGCEAKTKLQRRYKRDIEESHGNYQTEVSLSSTGEMKFTNLILKKRIKYNFFYYFCLFVPNNPKDNSSITAFTGIYGSFQKAEP